MVLAVTVMAESVQFFLHIADVKCQLCLCFSTLLVGIMAGICIIQVTSSLFLSKADWLLP